MKIEIEARSRMSESDIMNNVCLDCHPLDRELHYAA
jgi:hypothetical protein